MESLESPQHASLLRLVAKYLPAHTETIEVAVEWQDLPLDVLFGIIHRLGGDGRAQQQHLAALRTSCSVFRRAVDAWTTTLELR